MNDPLSAKCFVVNDCQFSILFKARELCVALAVSLNILGVLSYAILV